MSTELKDAAFTLMGWLLTPLGAGLVWATVRAWVRSRTLRSWWRWPARLGTALLALLGVVSLSLGVYGLWVRYRPQPGPSREHPFAGIEVQRFSRQQPRPIVVHVARVALDTPGLVLVPTAVGEGGCIPARTTSAFLEEFDVQLAINTQFFYRCPGSESAEEFGVGHPQRPVGVHTVAGQSVVERPWFGNTVFVAPDGEVSLFEPPPVVHHAFSGRHRLVEQGVALQADDTFIAPRLGLGFDASRTTMTIVLVDGRQRGYSEGLRLPEFAALLVELGVHDAIELDGGGSATLVIEDRDGEAQVLNSPIHTRIPGRERPVANHLGIRVGS